jgi:hypothetical protein
VRELAQAAAAWARRTSEASAMDSRPSCPRAAGSTGIADPHRRRRRRARPSRRRVDILASAFPLQPARRRCLRPPAPAIRGPRARAPAPVPRPDRRPAAHARRSGSSSRTTAGRRPAGIARLPIEKLWRSRRALFLARERAPAVPAPPAPPARARRGRAA